MRNPSAFSYQNVLQQFHKHFFYKVQQNIRYLVSQVTFWPAGVRYSKENKSSTWLCPTYVWVFPTTVFHIRVFQPTVIHICACSKGICSTCIVCVSVEDCVSYSETQEGGDKVRKALAIPGRLLIHRNTWNSLSKARKTEISFLKSF